MTEYAKPLTRECTKKIFEQMDNSIYKININNKMSSFCFFSYIRYKKEKIPVMITNYKVINDENSSIYNINILINGEFKELELGNAKYINKNLDLSIIQIKVNESDKINFLGLDDELYQSEPNIIYNKETIYIFNCNDESNQLLVSYGIINNIKDSEIKYSGYKTLNNERWPILSTFSNKLIGVYLNSYNYYNRGILLNYIINEFINDYKYVKIEKKTINEINILINVDKKDINKKIYFLNSIEYEENEEINKLNPELYIMNKAYEFKKFFIPEKKGEYQIKLLFNENLKDCSFMFAGCEKIIDIDFVYFNTNDIANMKYMFHRCKNLKALNLFGFNTKYVKDMSDMFSFCENLISLDLSSFNTINVQNISYMFYYCYNLKHLDISSFDFQNINKLEYAFEMCQHLSLSSFPRKNNNCINKYENEINIIMKVENKDINKKIYFLENDEYNEKKKSHNYNLKELNNLNTRLYINNQKYAFQKYLVVKRGGFCNVKLKFKIYLTDCRYMFFGCKDIMNINFDCFNSKYIRNMKKMFLDCNNLYSINFFNFKTKNVTDMSHLFSECYNLNQLNLSKMLLI